MWLKTKHYLLLSLVFWVWFGLWVLLTQLKFFEIKDFDCQLTNFQSCPINLLTSTKKTQKRNILFNDPQSWLEHEQNLALNFKINQVEKIFPNKIKILLEPTGLGYLLHSNNQMMVITKNGKIITTKTQPDNLPKVYLDSQAASTINTNTYLLDHTLHQELMAVINALQNKQVSFKQINYYSTYEIAVELEKFKVILNSKEANLNVSRLATLLESKQLENLDLNQQIIDLRFLLPVLRNED